MTDLAAWLLEQIAEDEVTARAAANVRVREEDGSYKGLTPAEQADLYVRYVVGDRRGHHIDGTALMERFSPARVLAECEAKRRIVEGLDYLVHYDSGGEAAINAEQFLRLLAQPYADRPGFREEWRLATRAGAGA